MKTRILTIFFLSLCSICGVMNIDAQPRPPKVNYNSLHTHPTPPSGHGKIVPPPKIFNPVGHLYGLSLPGHKIMFNFGLNGRIYREGDNVGNPYIVRGNEIIVYSSHRPQRIIGTGKLSRDGRKIEWRDLLSGTKYRLKLIS